MASILLVLTLAVGGEDEVLHGSIFPSLRKLQLRAEASSVEGRLDVTTRRRVTGEIIKKYPTSTFRSERRGGRALWQRSSGSDSGASTVDGINRRYAFTISRDEKSPTFGFEMLTKVPPYPTFFQRLAAESSAIDATFRLRGLDLEEWLRAGHGRVVTTQQMDGELVQCRFEFDTHPDNQLRHATVRFSPTPCWHIRRYELSFSGKNRPDDQQVVVDVQEVEETEGAPLARKVSVKSFTALSDVAEWVYVADEIRATPDDDGLFSVSRFGLPEPEIDPPGSRLWILTLLGALILGVVSIVLVRAMKRRHD